MSFSVFLPVPLVHLAFRSPDVEVESQPGGNNHFDLCPKGFIRTADPKHLPCIAAQFEVRAISANRVRRLQVNGDIDQFTRGNNFIRQWVETRCP